MKRGDSFKFQFTGNNASFLFFNLGFEDDNERWINIYRKKFEKKFVSAPICLIKISKIVLTEKYDKNLDN